MTKIIIDKTKISTLYFCMPIINLTIYCHTNGYLGVLPNFLINKNNIFNNSFLNKTYT